MTYQICELVTVGGALVQRTRAATPEETAEIDARKTAPAPVPQSVQRKHARKVMVMAGLLDKVQPAINAIADPTQRALMQVEWDDSPSFERNSTALLQIAASLTPPLSSDDLDNLFRQAAAL